MTSAAAASIAKRFVRQPASWYARPTDDPGHGNVDRGRPYPGQKYRHGWIPIAAGVELMSEDQVAQDYGDELDRVEVGGACIVARSEGLLTVQTDYPDGVNIHAQATPHEAAQWADHIDAVRDGDPGGRDVDGLRVHRGESDELMLRWVDDPDAPAHPGVDLDDQEADEFAAGLRDMAYVTHDNATPPDDADAYADEFPEDVPEEPEAGRAAGADVTPGHDELHHYWTRGEGLAKWAGSPRPWTTLVAHLTKHVGPEKAKVFASRWFIEVFGYAAGSDKNRVAHGKPPRGHRVGPG